MKFSQLFSLLFLGLGKTQPLLEAPGSDTSQTILIAPACEAEKVLFSEICRRPADCREMVIS